MQRVPDRDRKEHTCQLIFAYHIAEASLIGSIKDSTSAQQLQLGLLFGWVYRHLSQPLGWIWFLQIGELNGNMTRTTTPESFTPLRVKQLFVIPLRDWYWYLLFWQGGGRGDSYRGLHLVFPITTVLIHRWKTKCGYFINFQTFYSNYTFANWVMTQCTHCELDVGQDSICHLAPIYPCSNRGPQWRFRSPDIMLALPLCPTIFKLLVYPPFRCPSHPRIACIFQFASFTDTQVW